MIKSMRHDCGHLKFVKIESNRINFPQILDVTVLNWVSWSKSLKFACLQSYDKKITLFNFYHIYENLEILSEGL